MWAGVHQPLRPGRLFSILVLHVSPLLPRRLPFVQRPRRSLQTCANAALAGQLMGRRRASAVIALELWPPFVFAAGSASSPAFRALPRNATGGDAAHHLRGGLPERWEPLVLASELAGASSRVPTRLLALPSRDVPQRGVEIRFRRFPGP